MAATPIGLSGIGVRFLFAFLLVALTWNPTRFNYVEWALVQWSAMTPLVVFAGLGLLAGWVFFARTTASSLGVFGIFLCMALAGVFFWILVRYNVVNTQSTTLVTWIALLLLSAILAAGMSWAHLRARWSGQATVDEVEER